MIETLVFSAASAVAILCAALMILQRHPVYSALYLILTFCSLAVLYLLLSAQFIAMVQVIVYAGAIMVLFLFIIFLLNLDRPLETTGKLTYQKPVAGVLTTVLALSAICLLVRGGGRTPFNTIGAISPENYGTIQQVGMRLFSPTFVFAFEATALILTVALVGVVVLAQKRVE